MWNHVHSQAASTHKRILRVSVDETCISLGYGDKAGHVKIGQNEGPVLVAKVAPTRGMMSNITFICDDPEVQIHLPQIIVGNESLLPKSALDKLSGELPTNVYLCREKSSWISAAMFAVAVRWLARALSHLKDSHMVVVLLDCAPVHLHELVWKEARAHNIALCVVPNGCTWLLQPCDTHVFRRYKAYIRQEYNQEQATSRAHFVPVEKLVTIVCRAIRFVLQARNWSASFDHNGYGAGQTMLSSRVLNGLQWKQAPLIDDDFGAACMQAILPRRNKVYERYVQTWFPKLVVVKSTAGQEHAHENIADVSHTAALVGACPAVASQGAPTDVPRAVTQACEPWSSRLRSRPKVWQPSPAASSSSSHLPEQPPAPVLQQPCPLSMPRLARLPSDPGMFRGLPAAPPTPPASRQPQ
jgi:hypothetical protein